MQQHPSLLDFTIMLSVGRPFHPDARWWVSTPERPNRQHCHPHRNKNKKSLLAPSSRIAAVSQSILEPTLCAASSRLAPSRSRCRARSAAACRTALERRRLLSVLPTATHHSLSSSSSRRGVVYGDYSSAAFFTTESASSPLVDFGELNDNTIKGLTSLLSVEQEIEFIAYTCGLWNEKCI